MDRRLQSLQTLKLLLKLKAAPRFELGDKGFAVLGLTTWLCRLALFLYLTLFYVKGTDYSSQAIE